jgi:hypothetical protein
MERKGEREGKGTPWSFLNCSECQSSPGKGKSLLKLSHNTQQQGGAKQVPKTSSVGEGVLLLFLAFYKNLWRTVA